MDRSIKPGDVIAVNDGITNTVGQVKKIGIRAVSVTTRDKKEYLIPNENLMINQVENWSYQLAQRAHPSAGDRRLRPDLELAEKLMLEAARERAARARHARRRRCGSPSSREDGDRVRDPDLDRRPRGRPRQRPLRRAQAACGSCSSENGIELPDPAARRRPARTADAARA